MLMILARLVRSESFWAVAKVRSPHTGPEPGYPRISAAPEAQEPRTPDRDESALTLAAQAASGATSTEWVPSPQKAGPPVDGVYR